MLLAGGAALHVDTLASGDLQVELLPAIGARLHRIRAFGVDVLRTPAHAETHLREPFHWGAYQMAPWCNRIAAGPIRVGRLTADLPANFPDGSAIHGQLYATPWNVVDEGLCTAVGGGDGWPWRYEVSVRVTVDGDTLRVEQRLTNLSHDPMPAGIGLHPWFPRSTHVAINAGFVYPTNIDSPPQPVPVAGTYDLRHPGLMTEGVDATWAGIRLPAVELSWPDHDIHATMTSDSPTLHITAALPRGVGAVAVEPQTHAPQGLRRLLHGEPGALASLEPGGLLAQTIEMSFRRGPSPTEVD